MNVIARRGGDGGPPSPRRGRTWWEVMHPEGSQGTWRDLPKLLLDSLRLVWAAGGDTFLVTSVLQLAAAIGIVVQLFVGKEVLSTVLDAGSTVEFADLAPVLVGV